MNDITSFVQLDNEYFYDTCERLMELLRKCLYHGIQPWVQIQIFYNRLMSQIKSMWMQLLECKTRAVQLLVLVSIRL